MKHVASSRTGRRSLAAVFALPLALMIASLAALFVGLLGDGWHDLVGNALLSLPLLAVAHAWQRRS